jgi:hypothetical protein
MGITIKLADELHREAKATARDEGTTLTQFVEDAVREFCFAADTPTRGATVSLKPPEPDA